MPIFNVNNKRDKSSSHADSSSTAPIHKSLLINPTLEPDDNMTSEDGETPEDELEQLRRDTYSKRVELLRLKKQTTADVNQLKADNYDMQTELRETTKHISLLQYGNTNLVTNIDQLDADKEKQQTDHRAEMQKALKDHESALSDFNDLNDYNLKLNESVAARQSWNEALRTKIKAEETANAKAKSKLVDKVKERDDLIAALKIQLAAKESECESVSRDYALFVAEIGTVIQSIADQAALEKNLTGQIQILKNELTQNTAEVNRLDKIATQQSSAADQLAAAYRKMASSTSRIQTLENAIKVAANEMKQNFELDNEGIRSLERDLADKKNSLASIRQLIRWIVLPVK